MLDVAEIDLAGLVLARNDAHPDGDWWFDTRTGASHYYGVDDTDDLPDLVEGVHVMIPRAPQPRSDVDDFFAEAEDLGVDPETVADLYRTYRGKGGLRRFRERVTSTAAADAWSRFALARESDRALSWLRERGLVDR